MSTRKSSLRIDRTIQVLDLKPATDQTRPRKNSIGIPIPTPTITLDQKLTSKLIFTKRLQKLQHQAIQYFYSNRYPECFGILEKCYGILEERSFMGVEGDCNFPQHEIYVRYLQSQFKFKLRNFGQAREFWGRATRVASRMTAYDKEKNKDYLTSLEALNVLLLFQEGRFHESVNTGDVLLDKVNHGGFRLNGKILRQLGLCKIQCLIQLNQFEQAIPLITEFSSVNNPLSNRQLYKTQTSLATCQKHLHKLPQAESTLTALLTHFKQQPPSSLNQPSPCQPCPSSCQPRSYLSKTYSFYCDLVQPDHLKCLYICKQWRRDCQFCDTATNRLFKMYYVIGDYEAALAQFAEIGDGYRRVSQDWEGLAEIKRFYGEIETAQHMLHKALELAKSDQARLRLEIKLLGFVGDAEAKEAMKRVQRKIKEHRAKKWIDKLVEMYSQYLITIGQQQRLQKLTKLVPLPSQQLSQITSKTQQAQNMAPPSDFLLQTAKFGHSQSNKSQPNSTLNTTLTGNNINSKNYQQQIQFLQQQIRKSGKSGQRMNE